MKLQRTSSEYSRGKHPTKSRAPPALVLEAQLMCKQSYLSLWLLGCPKEMKPWSRSRSDRYISPVSHQWHCQRGDRKGERINFMVVSPDAKKCILGKKKKCKAACLFPMAVLKLLPKIQLFSAKLASFMRTKFLLVHMWVADLFIWEGSVCVFFNYFFYYFFHTFPPPMMNLYQQQFSAVHVA